MKTFWLTIIMISMTFPCTLQAKHGNKKNDGDDWKHHKVKVIEGKWSRPVAIITRDEQQVIRDHVIAWQERDGGKFVKQKGLPPGLAKKVARGGNLPPGWQRKLVQGEVLPIVVYREVQPLPDVLLARLPGRQPGTRFVVIDDKVLLLAEATRTILDVFNLDKFL